MYIYSGRERLCSDNAFFFFSILFCLSSLNNQVTHSNRVWKCQHSSWGSMSLSVAMCSSCRAAGDKTLETKNDN